MTQEEIKKRPLGHQMKKRNLKIGLFASMDTTHNFERYVIENNEDLLAYKKEFPQINNFNIFENFKTAINEGRIIVATDEHHMSGYPTYCFESKDFHHSSSIVRIKLL